MYTVKLFNNWTAELMNHRATRIKGQSYPVKSQIKELTKIISQSSVTEESEDFTIYQFKTA